MKHLSKFLALALAACLFLAASAVSVQAESVTMPYSDAVEKIMLMAAAGETSVDQFEIVFDGTEEKFLSLKERLIANGMETGCWTVESCTYSGTTIYLDLLWNVGGGGSGGAVGGGSAEGTDSVMLLNSVQA